jgi:hypothetical protein
MPGSPGGDCGGAEHAHGGDVTWWYHVRIAIENLPSHAWNMEVLKEMPGEVCLLDKIDWMTYRQQASDILYCWAWMWFPDLLPRAKTITFFDNGSGQAPPSVAGRLRPQGGGPSTARQEPQPHHPPRPR